MKLKKISIAILAGLALAGCDIDQEVQTLEEYFLNNNFDHEQKNLSEKIQLEYSEITSEWGRDAFKNRCAWYELDRVVDGDTLIVEDGGDRVRVRMIGIDTPESKKEGTAIEPYALEASEALKGLLQNEAEVCLVEDQVGDKYDTYGRKLSYVFRRDGKDLNAQMISDGWARAYTRFPMERADEFEALEAIARFAGRGQWE